MKNRIFLYQVVNKRYLSIVLRKKVHFNKKRNLRRYFWHFLSEYKVIEFFCRWFMYILNAFFSIQCVSVSFKKRYAVNNTIVKNSDNVNFQKKHIYSGNHVRFLLKWAQYIFMCFHFCSCWKYFQSKHCKIYFYSIMLFAVPKRIYVSFLLLKSITK